MARRVDTSLSVAINREEKSILNGDSEFPRIDVLQGNDLPVIIKHKITLDELIECNEQSC